MTEILHQADVQGGAMDDFSVYVTLQPDGTVDVIASRGMTAPIRLTAPLRPLRVSLQMPYSPQYQPLRLTVTRETP